MWGGGGGEGGGGGGCGCVWGGCDGEGEEREGETLIEPAVTPWNISLYGKI